MAQKAKLGFSAWTTGAEKGRKRFVILVKTEEKFIYNSIASEEDKWS